MKNLLTTAVLATAFAFSAVAQADMITFKLGAGNEDVNKFDGLLSSLSLVAEDVGTGVRFTFQSSYDLGEFEGPGKIDGNLFYVWNSYDVFTTGEGVKSGESLSGAKYPGTNVFLGTADYTVSSDGIKNKSYSLEDDLWITSFVLNYDADNAWNNFIETLIKPVGTMDQTTAFTIGVHLQALLKDSEVSDSAKVVTFTIDGDPATTPEPASMLIFGLGAIGLGGMAVRRRRHQAGTVN